MLKVNELRIGNYIQCQESEDEGLIISQINVSDFALIYNKVLIYKPMLLNEDWIIKFGFIKRNDRLFTLNYFEIHFVNKLFYFKSYKLIPLLYIHQLQNTYFISEGVELELSSNVA